MKLSEAINSEKADYVVINRLIRLALHLDSVMGNVIFDLNKHLEYRKVIRQEIKKNLHEIRKKLKTNLKNDWDSNSEEDNDLFVENDEKFERMCYNFFRLGEGMSITIPLEYRTGDKVWTKRNDKDTLCIVKRVEINMVIKGENVEDKSFYVLGVLDEKMKETNEIIYRSDDEVFKHLKDMKNANI